MVQQISGRLPHHDAGEGKDTDHARFDVNDSGTPGSSGDLRSNSRRDGEMNGEQGGANVKATSKVAWDEHGPWAFANEDSDSRAAAGSAEQLRAASGRTNQVLFLPLVVIFSAPSFTGDEKLTSTLNRSTPSRLRFLPYIYFGRVDKMRNT